MATSDNDRAQASIEKVRRICEHWPAMSREDFRELLAPDCVYLNVPMPHLQCTGPDQSYDFLMAMMQRWEAVEFTLPLIRGDETAVLVERLERFRKRSGEGPDVLLRSMGAFELRDGMITQWRDYFDPKEAAALAG